MYLRELLAALALWNPPPEVPATPAEEPDLEIPEEIETVGEETIEVIDRAPPGAEQIVGKEALERDEQDDIHKVLAHVPGVYVRDEDGYGLRPNIGMRGAAAERSAKVMLLEDGIPIAPAPYSAPAAYYFPLVTRMASVEVVKGPAAIRHGPNTVGGVVDLHAEPIPVERSAYLDVAGGTDRYGKVHGWAGDRGEQWGVLAEYVKLRSDGFKDIDGAKSVHSSGAAALLRGGAGDSGFDKDDAQLTVRLQSKPTAHTFHRVDLKAGVAAETSNETYTGLTEADFTGAPQRRYAATSLDQMNWRHWRFRAAHRVEIGTEWRVETTVYRHDFHRAWGKVDGFVGDRDLAGILAHPESGAAAIYYAVLSGAADSTAPEEELIRGTNDRTFVSEGIDSRVSTQKTWGSIAHQLDAGVRLHFDRADRLRFEDVYRMSGGALVPGERPTSLVLDSRADTTALAIHAQDQLRWQRLEVSAGARVEIISSRYTDHLGEMAGEGDAVVPIPGGGVVYHATDELALLAGVHRGFVPAAPSTSGDASPESSVNYEAGARWRPGFGSADLIGFFSDYSNLKGTCTLSTGCNPDQLDDEFDGGRVHVWGAEAHVATDVPLGDGLIAPLTAAYTYTGSAFRSSFESGFAGWGEVMEGDELPYTPRHQVSLAAAVVAPRWEISAGASWRAGSRDVPGQGEVAPEEQIDALLTIDTAMHLRFDEKAELYLTCSNLLDEQAIVSRRPYGIRPNAPRLFALGYKARF